MCDTHVLALCEDAVVLKRRCRLFVLHLCILLYNAVYCDTFCVCLVDTINEVCFDGITRSGVLYLIIVVFLSILTKYTLYNIDCWTLKDFKV